MSILSEIRETLLTLGAAFVAPADLRQLPEEARASLPGALLIGTALDREIVAEIVGGPTRRYFDEYRRANDLLAGLAGKATELLRGRGHQALPLSPTTENVERINLRTPLPHKTVATRAGVGWIGRNALLITPEYGSAVRFASVLTDADLGPSSPVNESRCGNCTACVDACPGQAPSGRTWTLGMEREDFFDAHACHRVAKSLSAQAGMDATICGICIAVCPWTGRYLRGE